MEYPADIPLESYANTISVLKGIYLQAKYEVSDRFNQLSAVSRAGLKLLLFGIVVSSFTTLACGGFDDRKANDPIYPDEPKSQSEVTK